MKQRVTFYIDGFNFYYGLRRTKRIDPQWKDYYWINMVKLCESFLGQEQVLEKVVYFTASPLNPEKSSRQSVTDGIKQYEIPEKWKTNSQQKQ